MRTVLALMNRNRKLFFKDKGMLFTSMITPVILIVLYATFLAKRHVIFSRCREKENTNL